MKKFLLFICLASSAQGSGHYVIGSVGQNHSNWLALMPDSVKNSSVVRNGQSSFSHGLKVGYKINKNLAAELNYFDIVGLRKDSNISNGFSRQDHSFISGLFKYYPNVDVYKFKPYFSLGYSHRRIIEKGYVGNLLVDRGVLEKYQPIFSLGADFMLSKHCFVNIDYVHHGSFVTNNVRSPSSKLINLGIGMVF